jgi:MFS family permease
VLAGLVLGALAVAGPAFAAALAHHDDGEVASPLGWGMSLLLFVVIPFGVCGLVAALVLLPSRLRRPRYRPGRPWHYEAIWFAGPADPEQALATLSGPQSAKGGASAEW